MRWSVSDGQGILCVSKANEDSDRFGQLEGRLRDTSQSLKRKLELGEMDEKTCALRIAAEMARLYEETRKWAESH